MGVSLDRKWYKLLSREGVDITTISQIDVVFYDLIGQATKEKGELFFTILKDRNFTHFMGADPKEIGRYAYKKYFDTPGQIMVYYKEGKVLWTDIEKDTSHWSTRLSGSPTTKDLQLAFAVFKTSFENICFIYSIISWIGIEAWQIDFEGVLNELISRNHLEKQTDQILSTVYRPWKKTALIELQEKIAKGTSPSQLADEYQFLRSWCVVWHKPITEEWVKGIQTPAGKEKLKYIHHRN